MISFWFVNLFHFEDRPTVIEPDNLPAKNPLQDQIGPFKFRTFTQAKFPINAKRVFL